MPVFRKIEAEVADFQVLLKRIRPVSINATLFSVLHRFSALLSALITAIDKLYNEAFVTQES
jgi:hypothetical protein